VANRSPAPGELELVRAFLNTNDIEEGRDELATPQAYTSWLRGHGLLDEGVDASPEDLQRALAVREALRGLTLANNGGPLYPVDLATLNRASAESALRVRFLAARSARLESDRRDAAAALARILSAVFTAMVDGSWQRLKACRRHTCRWAFYDRSKNRSSTWCSMQVCGNRTKAETYRRRRQTA
jgi:predicted RNA-binding Zn ribbon-like protein